MIGFPILTSQDEFKFIAFNEENFEKNNVI